MTEQNFRVDGVAHGGSHTIELPPMFLDEQGNLRNVAVSVAAEGRDDLEAILGVVARGNLHFYFVDKEHHRIYPEDVKFVAIFTTLGQGGSETRLLKMEPWKSPLIASAFSIGIRPDHALLDFGYISREMASTPIEPLSVDVHTRVQLDLKLLRGLSEVLSQLFADIDAHEGRRSIDG